MFDFIISKLFDKKIVEKPVTVITAKKERRVSAIKIKPPVNTCLSKYFDGLTGLKSATFSRTREEFSISPRSYR